MSVQEPEFDPAEMDLPPDLVRDMLMSRYAATVERLGAPVYSSVGWHRATEELAVLKPPPADDSSMFVRTKEQSGAKAPRPTR